MAEPRAEKAYEKHAWMLLFVVGVFNLIGAFVFLISPGTGLPCTTGELEAVTGVSCSELATTNPQAANLIGEVLGYSLRVLGVFLLPLAVITMAVALKSYRTGEKWAWYALWILPFTFGLRAATVIGIGWYSGLAVWVSLIIVSLLGLMLPYRKFFPKTRVTPS